MQKRHTRPRPLISVIRFAKCIRNQFHCQTESRFFNRIFTCCAGNREREKTLHSNNVGRQYLHQMRHNQCRLSWTQLVQFRIFCITTQQCQRRRRPTETVDREADGTSVGFVCRSIFGIVKISVLQQHQLSLAIRATPPHAVTYAYQTIYPIHPPKPHQAPETITRGSAHIEIARHASRWTHAT